MPEQVENAAIIQKNDPCTIKLTEESITDLLYVSYHTLNSNKPRSANNYIGVWRASDGSIPCEPAEQSVLVDRSEASSQSFSFNANLQSGIEYILGYCLAGDPTCNICKAYKQVCASVIIPATGVDLAGQKMGLIDLSITAVGAAYKLTYTAIENMFCKDKSWIGIWEKGEPIMIEDGMPKYHVLVTKPSTTGTINLEPAKLNRGTDYKLGFFMDGYDMEKKVPTSVKTLGSLLTFETS